jgi:hypothetical protein
MDKQPDGNVFRRILLEKVLARACVSLYNKEDHLRKTNQEDQGGTRKGSPAAWKEGRLT